MHVCVYYMDDILARVNNRYYLLLILVTGISEEKHLKNLVEVLQRLGYVGLHLKGDK